MVFKIVSERSENEPGEHFSCQTHCDINPYNLVPTESKQKILLLARLVFIYFCGAAAKIWPFRC